MYSTCAFNKKLKSRRTIYCLSEWVAWKGIKKSSPPCNWKIFACIPHKTAIPSVIKLGGLYSRAPFIALLRHVFHFPISARAPLRGLCAAPRGRPSCHLPSHTQQSIKGRIKMIQCQPESLFFAQLCTINHKTKKDTFARARARSKVQWSNEIHFFKQSSITIMLCFEKRVAWPSTLFICVKSAANDVFCWRSPLAGNNVVITR